MFLYDVCGSDLRNANTRSNLQASSLGEAQKRYDKITNIVNGFCNYPFCA